MLKWHFAVLYLWRLWHWSTAEWDTWKEKVGGANSDDVSTNYKQTPKHAATKQAAHRTQTTAVDLFVISSVSAPSPVPSQDSCLAIIPAVTTAMQQPLCTRRWVLHLPAQTHSMCRMQQPQPPSASHTHTHPPPRLIKDTASQWPLLQPLWSRLDIKGEEKLFTSLIRKNEAGEQGTIIPPFNSQKHSRMNFFFNLHLYKWGSPDQRRIVGKQGGPESIWWWWQVRKLKKKKLWNKVRSGTFERGDLMLDRPSRIHAHGCWVSKQQSLSPAMSAQHWSTTLEDVNVPQLTAACFYHSLPPSLPLPLFLCSHRTWQLSVFVLSRSLSLCPLAHKPCQQRNCERRKHTSLFSSFYPSLLLFLLILVVFHREVPQPVILHHHITSTHAAGVEQAVQSVSDSESWVIGGNKKRLNEGQIPCKDI